MEDKMIKKKDFREKTKRYFDNTALWWWDVWPGHLQCFLSPLHRPGQSGNGDQACAEKGRNLDFRRSHNSGTGFLETAELGPSSGEYGRLPDICVQCGQDVMVQTVPLPDPKKVRRHGMFIRWEIFLYLHIAKWKRLWYNLSIMCLNQAIIVFFNEWREQHAWI